MKRPEVSWLGEHMTVEAPEKSRDGVPRRRCLRCGVVDGWWDKRCLKGLVTHLRDPLVVAREPERYPAWEQPEVLRALWRDLEQQGYVVRVLPSGPVASKHRLYAVCKACNGLL